MKKSVFLLLPVTVLLVLAFVFFGADISSRFIMSGRLERTAALILVSICIAYSTIVFQTITNNKILTPALMGYEHLFVCSQVLLLMIVGPDSQVFRSKEFGFIFSCGIMILYSLVLYLLLFRNNKKNVYYILLIGLVLGIFFSTSTQFLQMTIDPNEYGYVQGAITSALGHASGSTLLMATGIITVAFLFLLRSFRYLDILNLGRTYALGLGVDYDNIARNQLLGISVLIAVSTALIGPITFVGIFISNITYKISNTVSNARNIIVAISISIILMICAEFCIEHLLNYRHSLGTLINLLGGIYFIVLIQRFLKKVI